MRLRIQEYIAFGAIVQLLDDHPRPFGVQPLHVIIKEGKKPRLVIDLSPPHGPTSSSASMADFISSRTYRLGSLQHHASAPNCCR